MADFLGAMFQGIGDTFKAGASVDTAKLANENAYREQQLQYAALDSGNTNARLLYLTAQSKKEQNIIIAVVIGLLLLIGFITYSLLKR